MNALLLPIVLGLLLVLEAHTLPEEWRMRGVRKYILGPCAYLSSLSGSTWFPKPSAGFDQLAER